MNTSYFAKSGKHPKAVSIARGHPADWKGREYLELAPPWELINLYKCNSDEILYTNYYQRLVLDKLKPEWVYKELGDEAVLLCWEGKGKFCHRRLVADWFKKHLNIEVPEL